MFSRLFQLKEHRTTVKTEFLAGLTTFLTMAYILVVNPGILSSTGIPFDQVFMATIISAVIGTLWMAFFANYPIAIAPGMGLNVYFVVLVGNDIPFTVAFGAVFVAGLLFVLLSLTPLREKLIEAIPENLKHAITAGIGLFIAFIGLRLSGFIAASEENLVQLGDLSSPGVILTIIGLAITLILMVRDVKGALFFGMVITGIIAFFTGQLKFTEGFVSVPSAPNWFVFGNPLAAFGDIVQYGLFGAVFAFLLVTIFDTTGTMVGIAEQAGLMKEGKMPRARQALLADSIATMVGSIFGTSPTSAYIESSSGVAVGGRTGLTTLFVALFFMASAFFGPMIGAVAGLSAITAPALIVVGSLMLSSLGQIEWHRFDETFPAFLIILTMPLTSSIATGMALGFISYPLLKVVKGEWRSVHPLLYVFAILFLVQLIFVPNI